MAVVEHLGDAYGGHYVCYGRRHGARGPDWLLFKDSTAAQQHAAQHSTAAQQHGDWLLFNDAQVRPATLHEVAMS